MNNDNDNNIDNYNLLLGLLQVFDILLNVSQVSNDTLLKELQQQNDYYLERIVNQNKIIIKELKEIKKLL